MADGTNQAGQNSVQADLQLALADTFVFSSSVISELEVESRERFRLKIKSDRAMGELRTEKERRTAIEDKYNSAKEELERLSIVNKLLQLEIEEFKLKNEANLDIFFTDRETQTLSQTEAIHRFSADFRSHIGQLIQIQDAQKGALDALLNSVNSVDFFDNESAAAEIPVTKQDLCVESVDGNLKNAENTFSQLAAAFATIDSSVVHPVDASAPPTKDFAPPTKNLSPLENNLAPPTVDSAPAIIGSSPPLCKVLAPPSDLSTTNNDAEMQGETPIATVIGQPSANEESRVETTTAAETTPPTSVNDAEKIAQLENELNKSKSETMRWALKFKHLNKKHETIKERLVFREKEMGCVMESLKNYVRSNMLKHSNES